ncbi:putative transposase [Escherichia coli ARS4.2123]|nr:putative transposase [Escherichia coli ARS4.2123]
MSLASSLAQHAGLSIVKLSQSTAQVEGAYRLIRNGKLFELPEVLATAGSHTLNVGSVWISKIIVR